MEQFDEYCNELVYNRNGKQIFLDDMNDTSESDSESDGGYVEIESDSIIETAVVDGVTVQVIVLLEDDSNNEFFSRLIIRAFMYFILTVLYYCFSQSKEILTRHYWTLSVIRLIMFNSITFKLRKIFFKL